MNNTQLNTSYNPMESIRTAYWNKNYDEALRRCHTLSYSIFHKDNTHSDLLWENTSIALCNALILEVCRVCHEANTPELVTMDTVSDMLSELGTDRDENGATALDKLFGGLATNDLARRQYEEITVTQGPARLMVYTTTFAGLQTFVPGNVDRASSVQPDGIQNAEE